MSDPVAGEKKALRSAVQKALKAMPEEEILKHSEAVVSRLFTMPEVHQAKGFSIYVNMGCEVVTTAIITGLFSRGKRVFVPCVTGKRHCDMKMVEVKDYKEIESWPLNKWGIKELPVKEALARPCMLPSSAIDVVFCPGVAFTREGHRLGHGRGYYDSFLSRLTAHNATNSLPPPTAIGLSLAPQLVGSIPTSDYDVLLDAVITPTDIHLKSV
eukprot:TRINITY_DN1288_c5_g1_i1.p1 TRINITY_DN1288_c5_g1~~TRINITY_DN1288_c5_g1_i1.p1  ORF type:complete len:213 (+),score=50.62 TRINITY_DN1288_c5_g1_i1:67-705(+)